MAELTNRLDLANQFTNRIAKLTRKQGDEFRSLLGNPPDPKRITSAFWERVRKQNEDEIAAILLLIFMLSYDVHRTWGEMVPPETTEQRDAIAEKWTSKRAGAVAADLNTRSFDILNLAGRDWDVKAAAGEKIHQSQIDDVIDSIFGKGRAERIGFTETQQGMINGGDAGIKHAGVAVTVYWGHTGFRLPGHSGAAIRPCPICTPREGLPESQWGGYTIPAHIFCDCFKVIVDENDFVVGTGASGARPGNTPNKTWKFLPP